MVAVCCTLALRQLHQYRALGCAWHWGVDARYNCYLLPFPARTKRSQMQQRVIIVMMFDCYLIGFV